MQKLRCALFGIVLAMVPAEAAIGQNIRVATYNVNYANRRGDQVLDAIAAARPDVLCFQETTLQSEFFLRQHLAASYPWFHSAGDQGEYLAERFAFVSKSAPREITFHPPESGLFGFYGATFTVGNKDIRIVNVHLTPFGIPAAAGVVDAMTAISKTEEAHTVEMAAILKSIDPDTPTIICGDFNSLSSFRAPQTLLEKGFTDSFAAVNDDPDKHITWEWPTRPLPLRLRIDYVFHSQHFQTVESTVVQREGSDHFLLVSELRFIE